MSVNSPTRCNCYPKTISYKEVKHWATAYLRLEKKPTDGRLFEKFQQDVKEYQNFVRDYFEDFNKNVNTTLRVAFLVDRLDFPGDPYFKIAIYLEYTDRLRYYETQKGMAAPGEAGNDEPDAQGTGGSETMNPETNGGKDMQMDESFSGPGTVTPPRCPPDAPRLSVSKVTYC